MARRKSRVSRVQRRGKRSRVSTRGRKSRVQRSGKRSKNGKRSTRGRKSRVSRTQRRGKRSRVFEGGDPVTNAELNDFMTDLEEMFVSTPSKEDLQSAVEADDPATEQTKLLKDYYGPMDWPDKKIKWRWLDDILYEISGVRPFQEREGNEY